jgi:hypothetical protein
MDRSPAAARPVIRVLAVVMATSTLVGGYADLELYDDGYNDIPVGNIGGQFLLNAIGAVAIAGGVVWGAISLVALFVARTDGGWFGFTDRPGLDPSPEGGARRARRSGDGRPRHRRARARRDQCVGTRPTSTPRLT